MKMNHTLQTQAVPNMFTLDITSKCHRTRMKMYILQEYDHLMIKPALVNELIRNSS